MTAHPQRATSADGAVVESLWQVVAAAAEVRPDAVAVDQPGRTLTFAGLAERAGRISAALVAEATPGSRVAWIGPNHADCLAILYGADRAGFITTPLNTRLSVAEMTDVLADVDPSHVVIGPGSEHLAAAVPAGARLLVADTDLAGATTLDAWVEHVESSVPAPVDPHRTTLLLYTSGTTGRPKGIELTADAVAQGLGGALPHLRLDSDSVVLAPVPYFHITGLGQTLLAHVNGATVLIRETPSAEALFALLQEHGVTHIVAVPTVVQRLVSLPQARTASWDRLVMVGYGGSPMPPTVLREAAEVLGCDFMQGYGLSESSGGVVMLSGDDHRRAMRDRPDLLTTVGRAAPGAPIRIVDPLTLEDVEPGVAGEVLVGGGHLMKGYWRNPDATAAAITPDGWLRTGDGGSLDPDGYLTLHDRLKDMIVSGGENVYPTEIENVLRRHPAVEDVAVIGIPDERWGETPWAVVVRAPDADVTERHLIDLVRESIAHYKCPSGVTFVRELPRNPSGKLLKNRLRTRVRDGGVAALDD